MLATSLRNNAGTHYGIKTMKFLILCILAMIFLGKPAIAQEPKEYAPAYPKEYAGYIEYEKITNTGERVSVRKRVKYKIEEMPEDNDNEYRYMDYNAELNRYKKEQNAREIEEQENNKINSAANYPIYFDN